MLRVNLGDPMADLRQLDRVFQLVMDSFVRTGRAPADAEIAAGLGVDPDEGRRLVRALFEARVMPMWLDPQTGAIASFAPFHATPTRYRVTVGGHQRWYGQ